MEAIIKQALHGLDQFLINNLDDDKIEIKLFEFYDEYFSTIKQWGGTSSGFTGLSEYLFFRFILLKLNTIIDDEFEVKENTKETRKFITKDLVLLHDIVLEKFIGKKFNLKPDISLLKKEINGSFNLIAVFEVKIYITDRNVLTDLLKRFEDLYNESDAYLFVVIFGSNNQLTSEIESFRKEHSDRFFVIGRASKLSIKIGLQATIAKICTKLNV